MIEVKIYIKKIDYKRSIINLFPKVMESVKKHQRMPYIYRVLEQMGKDSAEMAADISSYLSVRDKNKILCELLNRYRGTLMEKTGTLLKKIPSCEKMSVRDLEFQIFKGRPLMVLQVEEATDDMLAAILKNTAIFVMNKEGVRQKILMHIKSILRGEGVIAVFDDMTIEKKQERREEEAWKQEERHWELSEETMEKIADALAEYMKDLLDSHRKIQKMRAEEQEK